MLDTVCLGARLYKLKTAVIIVATMMLLYCAGFDIYLGFYTREYVAPYLFLVWWVYIEASSWRPWQLGRCTVFNISDMQWYRNNIGL